MTIIVTGWGPDGWTEYARRCVETFLEFWPEPFRMIAYVEEEVQGLPGARIEQRDLNAMGDWMSFHDRHAGDAFAEGREQKAGFTWKAKCVDRGYNFRFDAVKFGRIPMICRHAARGIKRGPMAWIDADTVTLAPVPEDLFENLLPVKMDIAYLGRRGYHSECGFLLFRLPAAAAFIDEWADLYASDLVFTLSEWHNSFAFDHLRLQYERRRLKFRNLTPGGNRHCWVHSPLGELIDHKKGDKRKRLGYSPERMTNR